MRKTRKRFGFGSKADNEQKRDELRKKKVNTVKSHWGSKRKEADERSPVKRKPSYEVLDVKIAEIKNHRQAPGVEPCQNK